MADPQVNATLAGVEAVQSAVFTLCHGISPSSGMVEIFPQSTPIREVGDLTFFAGAETVTIKNCKIERATGDYSQSSATVTLRVIDRRWKWECGRINGHYNILDRKKEIKKGTKANLRQLMRFCLDEMGERNYDLSQVGLSEQSVSAIGPFPRVHWDNEVPAKALASLCDTFGYGVVLRLDDTVAICPLGIGKSLPTDDIMFSSQVVNPPEKPDSIIVIGSPTQVQMLVHTEAVGRDTDGSIKPIAELSYAPALNLQYGYGWTAGDPEFLDIKGRFGEEAWRCARESVFKWFRIKVSTTDPAYKLEVPYIGHPEQVQRTRLVESPDEILPLSGELVETFTENGAERRKVARVYGTFDDGSGVGRNNNADHPEYAPIALPFMKKLASFPGAQESFSIDEEFGIVKFPMCMHRWETFTTHYQGYEPTKRVRIEADLWLMCRFNLRNITGDNRPQNGAMYRYLYERDTGGQKFGTKALNLHKEDELQIQLYATYEKQAASGADPNGGIPPGSRIPKWHFNRELSELNRAADHFFHGELRKYIRDDAADNQYMGFKVINPDGAIRQVSFAVGADGPITRACRNTEMVPFTQRFTYKRFVEQLEELRQNPLARLGSLPLPEDLDLRVF